MNEGDESIPSTKTRKKKRGSSYRYSNKKDLERSKLKRLATKARRFKLATIRKELLYPSMQSSGSTGVSCGPHYLESIVEEDGGRKEMDEGISFFERDGTLKVSNSYI